ncbi:MAG: Xylulose kinase, partial [Labilithrix sp.]|nr:Xylulose kinase [Labilithrix sp.]
MSARPLVGIDIGTTGVRVAVIDESGVMLADASLPCPPQVPRRGLAEADPEAWWTCAIRLLAEVGRTVPLGDVAGVAVTGQAPTVVLVDAAGAVVRPAILWLDTRAEAEEKALATPAYYLGPKLAWLAAHEPESLDGARWLLQSHAFLAQRLTGEVAFDRSTAALAAPLFDLGSLAWREPRSLVDASLLPPVMRAEDRLGVVSRAAAEATGLRAGTPVAVGGGDFAAAALGAGVLREGESCLMLGTAGNLLVPRASAGRDPRLINAHHVGVGSYLSLGGTLSGGAQEWARRALAGDGGALMSFEALDAEASRVRPGSEGLLFLPYLQGERTPIWDVTARGSFVGLGLGHGRGHLWRAVLEGIALGFVDCQAVLEEDGVVLREVTAANGGGKSALFRQILCDALGVPLAYTPRGGGTVAGAAILAGLASGVLGSAGDARGWRG